MKSTLLALLLIGHAHGAEPQIDSILSAIVAVETGCVRTGTGEVSGKWSIGEAGEVSPFQLHPRVLQDLGVAHKSGRIHRNPVYAESIARLWLGRLHHRFGNWPDAVAAWNGGAYGMRGRSAQDYSVRVMALAETYEKGNP